jgi:glycosyltransferase involved in cell wall biosynthesis
MKATKGNSISSPAGIRKIKNVFVIPENHKLPSGGNLYNRFLIKTLKKRGIVFQILGIGQAQANIRSEQKCNYWVDTLCLEFIDHAVKLKIPDVAIFLIVHHLRSLEPDLDKAESTRERSKEQKILEAVTGFLVTSPFTKRVLQKRGLSEKPIFVVPPALCLSASKPKKKVLGFHGLMVSNLIPRKGILEFLEELDGIITENDDFQIKICGRFDIDPLYSRRCLDEIERKPLLRRSIKFLGPLSLARLRRIYESSSVFISSSNMETYGMAIQEANAFGLPILALDTGFVKTHISPGVNGFLYKSMQDLVMACLAFIRDSRDLNRLRNKNPKTDKEVMYTWEDAAKTFIDQYSEWHNSIMRTD